MNATKPMVLMECAVRNLFVRIQKAPSHAPVHPVSLEIPLRLVMVSLQIRGLAKNCFFQLLQLSNHYTTFQGVPVKNKCVV